MILATLVSMEAWNDEPRVRPIPIEDDPSSEFDSITRAESPGGGGEPPRRPWLPIILAAAAIAIVLGSVATFGALQEQDPPPADAAFTETTIPEEDVFTPTTVPAVSLQETVPGVTDRLTLVANGPNGPTALLWDPSFILPKAFPIELFATDAETEDPGLRLRSATFDAGGDFVAVTGIPDGEEREVLRVGTPTDISSVSLDDATSFVWHATDVAHLAWIEPDADGLTTLHTARVNPLSKVLMDRKEVASVTSPTTIVRWDGSGFVLNTGLGEVLALTTDGDELWRQPGSAITASGSTILVSMPDADADRLESVAAVDRFGIPIAQLFDEPTTDDLLARTVRMSGNTDLVARIDVRQDRTRIEMNGPEFAAVKILQYNDDVEPIGFTSNDKYLVFRADGSNDLIFFNWGLASIHVLAVPDQYGVVGLDLG